MRLLINDEVHLVESLSDVYLLSDRMFKEERTWMQSIVKVLADWYSDQDFMTLHTSGTTGDPKQILLPKANMISSAQKTITFLELADGIRALLCLPVEKIGGMMMLVRAIVGNWDLKIIKPSANVVDGVREKIHFVAFTPQQLYTLAEESPGALQNIEKCIVGGAATGSDLISKLFNEAMVCWATYGMTETMSHVALRRLNGEKPDNCFKALPGVTFERGQNGCLIIHSDHLPLSPLITRDVVTLFSDTSFEWLGRIDNVINTGGVKVYPELIEEKLLDVIKTPFFISWIVDPVLGQKVILVIEGSAPTQAEIKTMAEKLMRYEMPKSCIIVDQILITPTGKVRRQLHFYPNFTTIPLNR